MSRTTERACDGRILPGTVTMVGKRYGEVVVMARISRPLDRAKQSYVLGRCLGCGRQKVFVAQSLRTGAAKRCEDCRRRRQAEWDSRNASSRRLPSGETYLELSERTGVSVNTINQRWLRGWPESDLGLPVRRGK